MYIFENPVLQRELLVNLRMTRAFVLLLVYQAVLAAVVYFAWPMDTRLAANSDTARGLVNMFFLGQYILASLMTPSFAAASITGEKERKTYELLLATPLKPAAITLGKLFSSLVPLALLAVGSLPIVMLCLPLGGVSLYEVLAAYFGLILSIITFGMISVACSSYFNRTSAALVASYLLILPLALVAILVWKNLEGQGGNRLLLTTTVLPAISAAACVALFLNTCSRLLRPPDVGSEGNEVVDLEQEAQQAVGLVIQRDQFPDRLFAPPKRNDLMEDGTNPVYDKEIHSEIFSQGTLMLRLVIQISMFLAIPIMAFCLFINPMMAPWYIAYVVIFNMLVGPVFSAGGMTSERERQTLDLLLTTIITPWQILSGKLIAGLRVSSVLTLFLVWPLILGVTMVRDYWSNLPAVGGYAVIIALTCITTAIVALFCSSIFQKTTTSLMTTYIVIILLFCAPLAVTIFAKTFMIDHSIENDISQRTRTIQAIHRIGVTSPFVAAFSIPMKAGFNRTTPYGTKRESVFRFFPLSWGMFFAYVGTTMALNATLLGTMVYLFNSRWRVSQSAPVTPPEFVPTVEVASLVNEDL